MIEVALSHRLSNLALVEGEQEQTPQPPALFCLRKESPETPLPEEVVSCKEPFIVLGAIAGGGATVSKKLMLCPCFLLN